MRIWTLTCESFFNVPPLWLIDARNHVQCSCREELTHFDCMRRPILVRYRSMTSAPIPPSAPAAEGVTEPTDEDLMGGIQQKKPEALAALYDRYSGVLKALILRIVHNDAEADDLLQEIYMEVWNQARNYSPEKGKPLGWLVTLTRRRSIDRLRKRQSYARAEERLQLEIEQQPDAWVHNTVDFDLEISDLRQVLGKVIASLPAAQQQAIELAFFKGMSQREIAAHTNIPLGTIKTRLELGLKKIADGLKGFSNEF